MAYQCRRKARRVISLDVDEEQIDVRVYCEGDYRRDVPLSNFMLIGGTLRRSLTTWNVDNRK